MSHLETSNADTAQSKDVWNENLEFLMSSADCLLSADCLPSHLETSNRQNFGGHLYPLIVGIQMSSKNFAATATLPPKFWNTFVPTDSWDTPRTHSCSRKRLFFTIGQILFRAAGHLENFPSCSMQDEI